MTVNHGRDRTPLQTTPRKGYRPSDSRDVTSELAAFSARGMNGARTASSVTEALRKELPQGRALVNVEAFFKDGRLDSTGLAEALKQRDEEEQIESQRATKRAEAEYEETLRVHRERQRQSGVDVDVDASEPLEVTLSHFHDPRENTPEMEARRVASKTSRLRASVDSDAKQSQSPITMREITDEDIDHLWDWLRADPQPNGQFFKSQFKSSRELFSYIGNALSNHVPIRAIDHDDKHVGLFALWPVSTTDSTALLHVYLAPSVRGSFNAYFPYILSGVRKIIPATMAIVMHAASNIDAFERLLKTYNFTPHTMFVQPGAGRDTEGQIVRDFAKG